MVSELFGVGEPTVVGSRMVLVVPFVVCSPVVVGSWTSVLVVICVPVGVGSWSLAGMPNVEGVLVVVGSRIALD